MKHIVLAVLSSCLLVWSISGIASVYEASAASGGGTPKLQTGKIYDAVYQCTRQIVVTSEGATAADVCYAEAWIILEAGKDGWYRIGELKSGGEWYANINRLSAIREHVQPAEVSTPADVDPGPRIQARR